MDLRKIGGHGLVLMFAFIVGAFFWGYAMTSFGFDSVITVGLSLGFFLLIVVVYLLYTGILSTRIGKKVAG